MIRQPNLITNRRTQRVDRHGFTLIELLLVIGIMLILAGVAIPTVRFLTRDREIREATRMVNTFIESARNDALATGRAGVMIERSDNDLNKSLKLFKVKFPPPYSGDTYTARAIIRRVGAGNFADVLQNENLLLDIPLAINPGDEIQFDNKGPWYEIIGITTNTHPSNQPGYQISYRLNGYPPAPHGATTSYQIRRQPIKNNSSWVELPRNTFVDLNQSGFAVRDTNRDDTSKGHLLGGGDEFATEASHPQQKLGPVVVTFRDDGEMDKVYFQYYDSNDALQIYAGYPYASVFFLVAFDNTQNDAQPVNNLLQQANAWVSVSRGHGKVTTGELNVSNNAGTPAQARYLSRQFARSGVTQGGS